MHNIRNIVYIILVLCLIFTACNDPVIVVEPEKIVSGLGLENEQRDIVKEHLDNLKSLFGEFYRSVGELKENAASSSRNEAEEQYRSLKYTVLDSAMSHMRTIARQLDKEQKRAWFRTNLFTDIMTLYRSTYYELAKEKSHSFMKKIPPQAERQRLAADPGKFMELWDKCSVVFGNGGVPGVFFNILSYDKTSQNSRNFPLLIRATMMFPELENAYIRYQYDKKAVEGSFEDFAAKYHAKHDTPGRISVKLNMVSSFYETYLDPENWIIYLVINKDTKIEPVKIIRSETPWIENEHPLFGVEVPNFIRPSDRPRPGRSDMMGEREWMSYEKVYYELQFPSEYDGRKILDPATDDIKLVFLKEIDSGELASGIWRFY